MITVASFLLIPPLNQTLHEIYVKNRVVRLHVKRSGWLIDGAAQKNLIKIEKINVDYRDDVLHVIVDMFATRESLRNAQQRVNEFQSILSAELGEPVVVELEIIPIDLIRIRSAPSNSDKNSE